MLEKKRRKISPDFWFIFFVVSVLRMHLGKIAILGFFAVFFVCLKFVQSHIFFRKKMKMMTLFK